MKRTLSFILLTIVFIGCDGESYIDISGIQYQGKNSLPLPAAPSLSGAATSTELHAAVGMTTLSITPPITGEELTFSVSPALASGLILNTSTGEISGIPSVTLTNQEYTITATNETGSIDYKVYITSAAGFDVNATGTAGDSNQGDGVCETATPGECTVVAAIEEANTLGGSRLIVLRSQTYTMSSILTINNPTADITVAGISQSDTILSGGNSATNQFNVSTGGSLKFKHLTVTNFGSSTASAPSTVLDVTGNSSVLSLEDVTVKDNFSATGGNGVIHAGTNAPTINLTRTTIQNNVAGNRGVIYVHNNAIANIDKVLWHQNTGDDGGCLQSQDSSNTTITNSICIDNTTVSTGFSAINIGTCGCPTQADLKNNLIANNDHLVTGQTAGFRAGRDSSTNTFNITLSNNIIASNVDDMSSEFNCIKGAGSGGTFNDGDGNLLSNNNCSTQLPGALNQFNTDPLLADSVPTDHGGGILSIALAANSPAVDAGNNGNCATDDIRALTRPVDYLNGGALCDIGPYELQLGE